MNNAVWAMLTETEKALLRDTERSALVDLDEDRLIALHDRVRKARTKYSKLYRRRASSQVTKDASRGRAHATQVRAAIKAEAFEDALARVSRQLAAGRRGQREPTEARTTRGGAERKGRRNARAEAVASARDHETGGDHGQEAPAHSGPQAGQCAGSRVDAAGRGGTRRTLTGPARRKVGGHNTPQELLC